jgi:hypothetical protein
VGHFEERLMLPRLRPNLVAFWQTYHDEVLACQKAVTDHPDNHYFPPGGYHGLVLTNLRAHAFDRGINLTQWRDFEVWAAFVVSDDGDNRDETFIATFRDLGDVDDARAAAYAKQFGRGL